MDILTGLLIALVGSIVSTAIYVAIVWRLDRYEKEPARMLVLAFLWGMLPAIIMSVILEVGLGGAEDGLLANAGIVPIVEESVKGLALLAFLVFSYRELDDVLDGIVYGAMIGFGFGFTENVLYVTSGVAEKGLAMGIFILILRTVVFGLNHAFFTSMTGAGMGAARLTRRVPLRLIVMSIGWCCAVFFHSIHNLGTGLAESTDLGSLGISILSDWMGVLILLAIVVLVWRKEQQWMTEELVSEVDTGFLTAEEYTAVRTSGGRQRLLARTLRRDGWAAYRRLGRLYDMFTHLAFKKRQVRLMGNEPGMEREIQHLRAAILKEKGAQIAIDQAG